MTFVLPMFLSFPVFSISKNLTGRTYLKLVCFGENSSHKKKKRLRREGPHPYYYSNTNQYKLSTYYKSVKEIMSQPHWHRPSPLLVTHDTGLMVMNSLTRQKEKFVTMDGGRTVKWYMYVQPLFSPCLLTC